MSFDERRRARDVRERGLVARIYSDGIAGGLDSPADFAAALAAGAQLLATDRVNEGTDPWATTSSAYGWPFRCAACNGAPSEPSDLVTVGAASGDLGAAEDSFFYAYDREAGASAGSGSGSGAGAETWSAFVSVPSSHVERDAKACIMARASDAPGAANAAVCRPFDEGPPRLQIRARAGGPTTSVDLGPLPGLSAETPAFLRLALAPSRTASEGASGARRQATTDVRAEASADGERWFTIGRATVPGELPLRGLAVSSRGGAPVRAIFGGVKRWSGRGLTAYRAESFASKEAIGAGATGEAFDGEVQPGAPRVAREDAREASR
jgi:hypothetical protein